MEHSCKAEIITNERGLHLVRRYKVKSESGYPRAFDTEQEALDFAAQQGWTVV